MFPQTGQPSPWASPGLFGPPQMGSGFPFNFGPDTFGSATPFVQFGASMLSSQLTQKYGLQQMQFLPTQNIYDQMRAQQALQNQTTAMATAGASDRRQVELMMRGAYTMATGQAPGFQQIAQMRAMSANTPTAIGMMTQLMGAQAVDPFFGKTGSAIAMASVLQRSGQTMFDPVSGGLGFSGRSGGIVANEMFNQLYGRNSNVAAMKGLTAGRAAELVEELGYRGMLDRNVGADPTRRNAFLSQLRTSPDMIQRLADQSEGIQAIRQSGRQPTAAEMRNAVEGVQKTLSSAQTSADVLNTAGGGDILRASQAQVLADKVKGMAGAVKAMEEIFGSEGKPNAPMREIVNRLNALTQGGMASMSGTQLESLVRRTQALSQSTGIQVESIQALAGQASAMADKWGVPRSVIPEVTLQAVAFAGGAKNAGGVAKNLDVGMSLEEMTLADQQLRLSAAASSGGADIAGVSRLVAEGALDIEGNTDAARMARAIRDSRTTFQDAKGNERSVRMTRRERLKMLEEAGVDSDTAEAVISDVRGNAAFQNADLGRKLQYEELVDRFNPIAEQAVKDQTKGLGLNSQAVGRDILRNMRGLTNEQVNTKDVGEFSKNAGGVVEKTLRDAMKAKGMSEEQINQQLTPDMIRNITLQMSGNINNQLVATRSGFKSFQNVLQLNSNEAFAAASKVKTETEADAQLRSALGGLATEGPLSRLAEAVKTAKPGEGIGKLVAGFLNAIPKDEKAKDKPTAAVMQLLEVLADAENNPIDKNDADSRQKFKQQIAHDIKVLTEGSGEKGDVSSMNAAFGEALGHAQKAEQQGDKKLAEKWRARAAKLEAVQGVTDDVIEGKIKPSNPELAGKRPGNWLERAGWAAVEFGEQIPGAAKFLQTAAGVKDAFVKEGMRRVEAAKAKAADGKLEGGDSRKGVSRIDGTLKLIGLDKAMIVATMESDDDSFEHGGVA